MAPFIDFSQPDERSWADVGQSDAGVNTVEFLEAARGVVRILELPGSLALKPVTADLNGNIIKVKERYEAAPEKSATLEQLVRNELAEGTHKATQGLLWLTRGLVFTSGALKLTQGDPKLKLSDAFQTSYGTSLSQYHNFVVKGIFRAAMRGCPAREDLYVKLKEDKTGGPPATDEELDEKLNRWLAALDEIATRIETFFTVNNYKEGL